MIQLGTVFRARYGEWHCWFVISDPKKNGDKIVCVNMTSFRGFPQEDLSCELMPNDHEAIKHRSWVYYEKTKIYSRELFAQRLKNSMIELLPTLCTTDLLNRIHSGAYNSDSTPDDVKAILNSQGFIPALKDMPDTSTCDNEY